MAPPFGSLSEFCPRGGRALAKSEESGRSTLCGVECRGGSLEHRNLSTLLDIRSERSTSRDPVGAQFYRLHSDPLPALGPSSHSRPRPRQSLDSKTRLPQQLRVYGVEQYRRALCAIFAALLLGVLS